MERRGVTAVDIANLCRVKPTFVYAVLRGECPLPEGRIDAIATLLSLNAADHARFRLEALAVYAPREVREALWKLQGEGGRRKR